MASKNSNAQMQNVANQQRRARTEAYAQQVKAEYAQAVNSILALKKTLPQLDPGVMYSFDGDSPKVRREVDKVLRNLYAANMTTIRTGIADEWEEANKEIDKLITSAVGKKALKNPQLAGWFARNEEALETFANRSENGMNLSDRIWKNAQQFRDEMEIAMTVAIGEGQSASQMSRKVRQYLDDPDLMFRRFRYKDEDGNWRLKWKKRVQTEDGHFKFIDYDRDSYKTDKTGAGFYKSSYKNAMRVARTETNMAYRRADHDRWQNLEFVLGQNITPSKAHDPDEDRDICDQLQGKYPKDFVFEGWHPQCMCSCTAIMVSEDEMQERMAARLRGEDYQFKEKPVTTYPAGFQKFVRENKDNILASRQAGKLPYFLQENYSLVEQVFNGVDITDPQSFATQTQSATATTTTGEVQATMTDDEIRAKVHEAFAAVNADIQDADIVIEDGHVVLTAQQAITLHQGMKTTPGQYDAIHKTYVGNADSFDINEIARFNNKREYDPLIGSFANAKDRMRTIDESFIKVADALDKAIAKNSLPFPVRVVRMVDAEALENLTGLSKAYGGTTIRDPDELLQKIKALGENVTMTEGGFMSFSFESNKNSFLTRLYRLKIDIPAGTPLYIPKNAGESEGILGRNTKMALQKIYKTQIPEPYHPGKTKEIVEMRCGVTSSMKATQKSALERAKERHAARTEEQKEDILGQWEESRRVNTMLEEAEKFMPDARRVFSWRMKDKKQDASDVAFRIKDISRDYANDIKGMAALGYQKQRDFLQEKIANIGRGEDAQLEKRALQQKLAEVEGHIAKGEHRDPMELKAARQAMRTEEQKKDIQKRWDATLVRYKEIRDNAAKTLKLASEYKDVDTTKLQAFTKDSNLTQMKRQTALLEKEIKRQEAEEKKLADIIPDVHKWHKDFTLDQLQGVYDSTKKNLDKWDTLSLDEQAKKLKFEAEDFLGGNMKGVQQKYSTWQVSQAVYNRRLNTVQYKIAVKDVEDKLAPIKQWVDSHPKATKVANLYDEAKAAIANGATIADIKTKYKDLAVVYGQRVASENAKVKAKAAKSLTTGAFAADAYTKDRKDKALWAKTVKEADNVIRDVCGEVWRNATQRQREALYEYTYEYCNTNEPLRGLTYINPDPAGDPNKPQRGIDRIAPMTEIIDKSSYKHDMWLQRGGNDKDLEKFGIHAISTGSVTPQDMKNLVGRTGTDGGFMSTAVAKGKGFNERFIFNIYAPAGTKMMYLEPFSDFGHGTKSANWDGISKQATFGGEAEMLLQRGTTLRITKVEYANGHWYIDAEVVGQNVVPFPYTGGYPFNYK